MAEFIARSLVEHPDEVKVTEIQGERSLILELNVASADIGKVIGRQGRIAKAFRTVLKAATGRSGGRVLLEIAQ